MEPDIRPSSDLRNHYAEVARECREQRRPVILTVNGRGDSVLMNIEAYNEMQSKFELLSTLAEAEEDVAAGRVLPLHETFEGLLEELNEQPVETAVV